MTDHDNTLARFERRFKGIEAEIPDRSFETLRHPARPRARPAMPSLAIGAALLLLVALVFLPRALGPSGPAAGGGPSSTPALSVQPSATPRVITTGRATLTATWTVMCSGTSDADCDGAVGLFANNLARSWQTILDESGDRLTVEPRACPTFNGLTARQCWDVTAVRPRGPFCMVVANDANDPRYPDYFQIGGQDGAGRAGGPPDGWPMCAATVINDAASGISFDRPASWTRWIPNAHSPINDGPLIYLSTDPLLPACATAPPATPNPADAQGRACSWPLRELASNGVLVTWLTTRILVPLPSSGEKVEVNGETGRLEIEKPGSCSAIGGDETLDMHVPIGQSTPWSNIAVVACLRGPDLAEAEAQVRAMLASAEVSP